MHGDGVRQTWGCASLRCDVCRLHRHGCQSSGEASMPPHTGFTGLSLLRPVYPFGFNACLSLQTLISQPACQNLWCIRGALPVPPAHWFHSLLVNASGKYFMHFCLSHFSEPSCQYKRYIPWTWMPSPLIVRRVITSGVCLGRC